MRGLRRFGIVFAAALALAAPAGSQPQLADPEGALVEELVVTPSDGGPVFWRIEDDDSTVYILGLPDGAVPKGLTWDTRGLERRLNKANALIGADARPQFGLGDIGAFFRLYRALRTKNMEADLPPELRARFIAARERVGKGEDRYDRWGPMMAGLLLMRDSRSDEKWKDPEADVRSVARKRRVDFKNPDRMPGGGALIREMRQSLTVDLQNQCLASALDDIEAGEARFVAAARGWARGDVAVAVSAPRQVEKCFLLMGGGAEWWRRAVDDQASLLAAQLEKPGKTVAMVRLRRLLAKDGVIETLESRGVEVLGPRERSR